VDWKDWMNLAFSIHDWRISSNMDSIVVTHEGKPNVLPPYNSMHAHTKDLKHHQKRHWLCT
jgi:hypothetical protein